MRRFQQLISCYLALSFAFAGAVGMSPVFHRLIEHGGQGPAHTHRGFTLPITTASHSHDHDHGEGHGHTHSPERPRSGSLFIHKYDFDLPTIPFGSVWHAISHFWESGAPTSSEPSAPEDAPDHQHHSLPEMMVNGLIDQALDAPRLPFIPTSLVPQDLPASTVLVARDWDAQTASRGPPSAGS